VNPIKWRNAFVLIVFSPLVVDRIHFAQVRAIQVIFQLQIMRGISEYQIRRVLRERAKNLDAVALQDLGEGMVTG
jgi:hypothetical protein